MKKPPGAARRSKHDVVAGWVLAGSAHRLLLVEDHDDAREMYASHFRNMGWEVEAVGHADDAVAIAAAFLPSVIIMDLAMAGISGIDAMVALKADPRTCHVPVVVLTAYADREAEARSAGCEAFVAKPSTPEEVMLVARSTLRSRSGKVLRPSRKPKGG